MNVSCFTLPETYLSKLRGVNQTCIVFCPNNIDSLPELMSTNCPNWGGGGQLPPDPSSRTPMMVRTRYIGLEDIRPDLGSWQNGAVQLAIADLSEETQPVKSSHLPRTDFELCILDMFSVLSVPSTCAISGASTFTSWIYAPDVSHRLDT